MNTIINKENIIKRIDEIQKHLIHLKTLSVYTGFNPTGINFEYAIDIYKPDHLENLNLPQLKIHVITLMKQCSINLIQTTNNSLTQFVLRVLETLDQTNNDLDIFKREIKARNYVRDLKMVADIFVHNKYNYNNNNTAYIDSLVALHSQINSEFSNLNSKIEDFQLNDKINQIQLTIQSFNDQQKAHLNSKFEDLQLNEKINQIQLTIQSLKDQREDQRDDSYQQLLKQYSNLMNMLPNLSNFEIQNNTLLATINKHTKLMQDIVTRLDKLETSQYQNIEDVQINLNNVNMQQLKLKDLLAESSEAVANLSRYIENEEMNTRDRSNILQQDIKKYDNYLNERIAEFKNKIDQIERVFIDQLNVVKPLLEDISEKSNSAFERLDNFLNKRISYVPTPIKRQRSGRDFDPEKNSKRAAVEEIPITK